MIFLQLAIVFQPAFVFPGEPFTVVTAPEAVVRSEHVKFRKQGDFWHGIGPDKPAEVWATIGEEGAYTDATMKVLPVAAGPAVARYGNLQVVPMHSGSFGGILGQARYPHIVSFDLAPRSAPMRARKFNVDYHYFGPTAATINGDADGLLRVSVRIDTNKVTVDYSTRFELGGTVTILGEAFELPDSPKGATGKFEKPIRSRGL